MISFIKAHKLIVMLVGLTLVALNSSTSAWAWRLSNPYPAPNSPYYSGGYQGFDPYLGDPYGRAYDPAYTTGYSSPAYGGGNRQLWVQSVGRHQAEVWDSANHQTLWINY